MLSTWPTKHKSFNKHSAVLSVYRLPILKRRLFAAQIVFFKFFLGILLFTEPASAQHSATLEKIRQTGTISIGYREGSVPFSYLDNDHQPIGYSMDICNKIVVALRSHLKLKTLAVRLVPMTPATRIPLVANGTIDLECGVTTNTLERQKNVAFSVTIFVTESRLVSKRREPISHIEALRGKTVVTTIGTTSMLYLNALNASRQLDMKILAGRDDADSFLMMRSGRAQAYAMDEVLLRSFIATMAQPEEYLISEEALSIEPYGIMLNKDDAEFKRVVDTAIIALLKSPEFMQIYEKWFLLPIPTQNVRLNLPISDALKRLLKYPTDSGISADYHIDPSKHQP